MAAKNKSLKLSQTEKKRLLELIKKFKKARVLVIGDFILDQFVWGSVDRISPEAPVPVVNVERESYMPGGSLNVASNLRSLSATVYPCGVIGRDLTGRMLSQAIRREGIETGGIVYDKARPTSLKTRVIAHSQQVVRFDREDASEISTKDTQSLLKFVRRKLKSVDAVIIEDYGKGVIHQKLVKEVIAEAKKHKKPILVDPKEKHFSYYKGATLLTPNRKEAYGGYDYLVKVTCKEPSLKSVAMGILKKLKAKSILITLGEDGMALFDQKGSVTKVPTTAREVYDVSGAGDTVIATFAATLAAGGTLKEGAILSNLAAGIVVGKLGTAMISCSELVDAVESA